MINLNKKSIALAIVVPFAGLSINSYAGEAEEQLIEKVTQAYGGKAVVDLANYRVEEHYINFASGQSHSPALTETGSSTQVLTVDIKNSKASFDTWFVGRGGGFQGLTITDGENAQTINHQARTYAAANSPDVYAFAGGTMRTSDAILVHELNKVIDKATIGEDEKFMNRPHHTLTMPFPSSPDLKLYIDAETQLISRMLRVNEQLGNLDYVYSKYKSDNGIKYASSTVFSVAGAPNLISTKRKLAFNLDIAENTFAVPDGFSAEAERIDTSSMLVNKISDRAYHVGEGNGYSLFVDTSMGTIGVGGYPALPARLDHYKQESKNYKPLTYQVVTHHHSDHLGAIPEAVAMGAKVVTVSENITAIKENTNPAPNDNDFLTVSQRITFGEGRNKVEVYEVSTIHAASFLLSYLPADKTVFIADHMGSQFASGVPVANKGTVDMLKAIDDLDLDVKKIATAHSARIFSIKDMRASVAAYAPSQCLGDRPVCK